MPGHVHLDLMRAGVIPDPFARLHERDVAWVAESDWEYETTFTVDDPVPGHAYLLFHGLDTVAEIALNGEALGQTDNMYVPHEFPVDGRLRAGENHLRVTFRSALRVGRERLAAWDTTRHGDGPLPRQLGPMGVPLVRPQGAVHVRLGLGARPALLRPLASRGAGVRSRRRVWATGSTRSSSPTTARRLSPLRRRWSAAPTPPTCR